MSIQKFAKKLVKKLKKMEESARTDYQLTGDHTEAMVCRREAELLDSIARAVQNAAKESEEEGDDGTD